LINDAFYFVDLPGYGFARAPTRVKREWGPMVERYLATRSSLVLSVLITDCRHGPTKLDLQMKEWLEAKSKPFVIIATKSDKLSRNELRERLKSASELLAGLEPIPYSAVKGAGVERLWGEITRRLS
jgi:GTP-binding protein